MKKLLSAMSLILGLGLATAQQTAPTTSAKAPQTVKATKPAEMKTAKPADVKTVKQAPTTPPAAKMKKTVHRTRDIKQTNI